MNERPTVTRKVRDGGKMFGNSQVGIKVAFLTRDGRAVLIPLEIAEENKTGFARVFNPYFEGDPDWRMKDGYTYQECESSNPQAIPFADAYLEFHETGAYGDEENEDQRLFMEFGWAEADLECGMTEEEADRELLTLLYWPLWTSKISEFGDGDAEVDEGSLTHNPFAAVLEGVDLYAENPVLAVADEILAGA